MTTQFLDLLELVKIRESAMASRLTAAQQSLSFETQKLEQLEAALKEREQTGNLRIAELLSGTHNLDGDGSKILRHLRMVMAELDFDMTQLRTQISDAIQAVSEARNHVSEAQTEYNQARLRAQKLEVPAQNIKRELKIQKELVIEDNGQDEASSQAPMMQERNENRPK